VLLQFLFSLRTQDVNFVASVVGVSFDLADLLEDLFADLTVTDKVASLLPSHEHVDFGGEFDIVEEEFLFEVVVTDGALSESLDGRVESLLPGRIEPASGSLFSF
jgi:hypothetical protein